MTVRLASVVGGDVSLLPHTLAHYSALGVETFHIVRHAADRQDPALGRSASVMADFGLEFDSVHIGPWDEDLNAKLIRGLMLRHPDDWWVVADLDEFHVYDRALADVVELCEKNGYDYVTGAFLDRVSEDGRLTAVEPVERRSLWDQYPMAGLLTHSLLKGRTTKVTIARGCVELDYGQHRAWTGQAAPIEDLCAQVHHFKWTASVRDRLEERAEAYSSGKWKLLHNSVVGESEAFLQYLGDHDGRIDVRDSRFAFFACAADYSKYPDWPDAAERIWSAYRSGDAAARDRRAARKRGEVV
ncbi:glycosyltransferase family 2 protein [Lentzea aerocolonigenes]|uniref:glycosyltransferase family 2 protein n=1 Tax=Lentzea aerocolonigenes TaxID=68170 RepID=UPI000AF9D59E|nr:glycosyltransferase family 2 protein [Lentzea aerocolonigenes]